MQTEIDEITQEMGKNALKIIDTSNSAAGVLDQVIMDLGPSLAAWKLQRKAPDSWQLLRAATALVAVAAVTQNHQRQKNKTE